MEIRLRSNVSRTSKGYSCEATLEMSGEDGQRVQMSGESIVQMLPSGLVPIVIESAGVAEIVDALSSFQITKLREHLTALEAAFPATLEAK